MCTVRIYFLWPRDNGNKPFNLIRRAASLVNFNEFSAALCGNINLTLTASN